MDTDPSPAEEQRPIPASELLARYGQSSPSVRHELPVSPMRTILKRLSAIVSAAALVLLGYGLNPSRQQKIRQQIQKTARKFKE